MTAPEEDGRKPGEASVVSVPIGGLATASGTGSLRTFLGSCVGVAIYDRRLRLGGLAHVVLPDSQGNDLQPGKYADTAVPFLVDELTRLARGAELRLTARLVGGAKMFAFQTGPTVGDRNVAALEACLATAGIPIVARDCGGSKGRHMTIEIPSGQITVESVGMPPTFL